MTTHTPASSPQRLIVQGEAGTARLAAVLSSLAGPGDIIALWGDLGVGKTAFARAFINELTDHTEEVPSPTFTLAQLYDTPSGMIYHFDMYRLEKPDDALELGVEDAFADGICLIEWPGHLGSWLPGNRLDLIMENGDGEETRAIEIVGGTPKWNERLAALPAWDTIEGIEADSPNRPTDGRND
ncbi:MAG: tRNA (adenosine(37)-N6)-threonylcarbamoyltransferase complex ATPase subunit type 1 TsaE [Rhodospirillales bacterium]|nr:tRNA (adenosine(37)-N6)-threonylcarbamoyltransferase complex ATPase subunit type 1 TsaE [Rhodospirillales bacterium]